MQTTIEIENTLATEWLEFWLTQTECNRNAFDSIYLASCRNELRNACSLAPKPIPPMCQARIASSPMCSVAQAAAPDFWTAASSRTPQAFHEALFSPGNIAGNALGSLTALNSLYHSLPPNWFVKVQGGEWDLFDANSTARRNAFGKAGKGLYPPKMMLRLSSAKIPALPMGAVVRSGQVRVPAPNAKTLSQALNISGVNKFQPISKSAFEKLYARKFVAGNAVGAALAFGPTAYMDVNNAGGMGAIVNNPAARKQFVLDSAKNQSTNAVGFGASVVAGAALVAVGVTSAPVLIVVGLVVGVGAQTGFVSFGADDWIQSKVGNLLD